MTVEQSGTRRLFVAVPVPKDLLVFVLEAQGLLPKSSEVRLLKPEQLHVTLAFVGRVEAQQTATVRAVVKAVPGDMGGEASVNGFVFLPSAKRARVVALGLTDQGGVFGRLFEFVMGGLERSKVMQREKRPFQPHLTVARAKRPGLVQPMSDCGRAQFRVESVCLYESDLRREGARYTIIERTDLTTVTA